MLQRRPIALLVEVETATDEMPDLYGPGIYALRPRARNWSLDKAGHAQVRRIGFIGRDGFLLAVIVIWIYGHCNYDAATTNR